MESQRFSCLFFMLTWIFIFFLSSICSGMDTADLSMETSVFVACKGVNLPIDLKVKKPANQSNGIIRCFNPSKNSIRNHTFHADGSVQLLLKNLTVSGEYSCKYQTAEVCWFLQVIDNHCGGPEKLNEPEFNVVAILTGVLLVFSMLGSVYVFRGNRKDKVTECDKTERKQKQNREERNAREMEEDKVDVISPSTSFYATLEPRPRSIYDVLDHSAAKGDPDPGEEKPKKDEPQKKKEETTQHQGEGVFDSVYENF